MKYVIGFAGVKKEVYRRLESKMPIIVKDNGCYFGKPIDSSIMYNKKYAEYFLDKFRNHELLDLKKNTFDVGYVIIYVKSPGVEPDQDFINAFFPFILAIPIVLEENINPESADFKIFMDRLMKAVKSAKEVINIFKSEVVERANKTPMLLPLKNFKSSFFCRFLQKLQEEIPWSQNKEGVLKQYIKNFKESHIPLKESNGPSPFLDSRGIVFRSPGKARHGFQNVTDKHTTTCILNGRFRLGAPYDASFHYDCSKEKILPLSIHVYGCHTLKEIKTGNPHLNISPNDFVR
ncbi:hypothetical protein [Iodobacter ciconiae]|uniref:Uncharacterized protein n=1 Tax=Iodobacter ciconiae TaxID=2496266 RepID=A0A3S8ZQ09_9NEIS|nr:hypothetical protein [Iodobacter ciconiae]AZN35547.1 hypothetical protein EJO50_03015 [Iodobacter ciconiae]